MPVLLRVHQGQSAKAAQCKLFSFALLAHF